MAILDKWVDIQAPLQAVYDQLTRYDEFPRFMEGVVEVRHLDGPRYHWRSECPLGMREWDSEIVEAIPGRRIAWHNLNDHANTGYVELESAGADRTQVRMHMEFEPPASAGEPIDNATRHVADRTERDLQRLKSLLQGRSA